jgi:membrane protein DedA with SNARE-associated domain
LTHFGEGVVSDWLLESGSYVGILVFMVLTGCGMPLPEEVAIVFAGVQSAQGDLQAPLALAACLVGALVGDAIMFGIGYRWGHTLLRRHPKLARLLGAEREKYFEKAILRHGFKVLLVSRFMVGVRGPVYLAAGVVRMPFRRFLLWDLFCATLVVATFFAISYYLGAILDKASIGRLLRETEATVTILVIAAAAIVIFIALRRHRRRLLEKVLESAESPPHAKEPSEPQSRRA